ncbi:M23 family metallopeptidase [Thermomonas sp. S9]|uniref:M23 family metallopeptidase n=1 Tax=Thermomonas sp. S9 TaxID=2885203 RepID=UPI00216AEE11|nr:M23 family metallopeptidase [Thermomonas sp. S9]
MLAARGGVVMQVQDGFSGHGLDPHRDASRANLIRILHDDGSMGLYAHLANGGARVRVGQRVEAGQRIGLSGNTGYSTAPHLHFAVQVNRGMQLLSIPFRLAGPAQGASAPD